MWAETRSPVSERRMSRPLAASPLTFCQVSPSAALSGMKQELLRRRFSLFGSRAMRFPGDPLPRQQASGSTFLAPDTRHRGNLFHPRRDLAFVDVLHGFELYTSRRLAHPHRADWRV